MDQTTYERWWRLHVRVARGEELDAAEQAIYESGLMGLDAEEKMQWENNDHKTLQMLKAKVESLETLHTQLHARSRRLDRQIWRLEGAYMMLTGLELSGQDHAPFPA